jgi:adenosine deaminase
VAHWEQHPVLELIDAGVLVTINTDDPAMFDVSLAGEFSNLEQRFGLDGATLKGLSLAVVEGSWADEETRSRLTGQIEAWWAAG